MQHKNHEKLHQACSQYSLHQLHSDYLPKGCLQQLYFPFIRPPLAPYTSHQEASFFELSKKGREHHHYTVRVDNFMLPLDVLYKTEQMLIYCHSQHANRLEAVDLMTVLPEDLSVALFDFGGCGGSTFKPAEEQHMPMLSLGVRESRQLEVVVNLLRQQYKIDRFIFWGRGLGADAIIRYGKGEIFVLDSPFTNLDSLLCQRNSAYRWCCGLPSCLVQRLIASKAGIDYSDLDLQAVFTSKFDRQKIVFWLASGSDQQVDMRHSIKLFSDFKGPMKELFIVEGGHQSSRSRRRLEEVVIHMLGALEILILKDRLRDA